MSSERKAARPREEIDAEIIGRAERLCGGSYSTRADAEAALAARRDKKAESVQVDCLSRRGTACPHGCRRTCQKDREFEVARLEREERRRAQISAANKRTANTLSRVAPAVVPIVPDNGRPLKKGKRKAAPKIAAEKGLKKVVVVTSKLERAEVNQRGLSVHTLAGRLKLTSFQEAAASGFAKDYDLAIHALRSPSLDVKVEGGKATPRHLVAMEAADRIREARRLLGSDDFALVVGTVIFGFTAERIHSHGGEEHQRIGWGIRHALQRLAAIYTPEARRPNRTARAIYQMIQEAEEGRLDSAADLLKKVLEEA